MPCFGSLIALEIVFDIRDGKAAAIMAGPAVWCWLPCSGVLANLLGRRSGRITGLLGIGVCAAGPVSD